MYILPNTPIAKMQESGNAEQAATAIYFDKNGNGVIDKTEADSFNSSKIDKTDEKISIKSVNGYTDTFVNFRTQKDQNYYKSGSIPVAVIDIFQGNGGGGADHGYGVSNIIKSINPDISVTQVNASPITCYNKFQQFLCKKFDKNPKLEEMIYSNKVMNKLMDFIYSNRDVAQHNAYINAVDKVQNDIDNGMEYKAVNLSSGYEVSYETINSIVKDELGVEITPENIKEYKTQVKDILEQKQDETIVHGSKSGEHEIKIKDMLTLVDKIENLNIPVYLAGSYYYDKEGTIDAFNLLALADNTLSVEAGTELPNGKIINGKRVSRNSLSLDENGNRRIADSICYDGIELYRGSTSFATPMVLAKELTEKYSI